jgi:hypothetical protein
MTAWMYEGNGMKLMREFYRQYNFVNLPMGNTGSPDGRAGTASRSSPPRTSRA